MVGQKDRGKGLVRLRDGVLTRHVLLHRRKEAGKRILGVNLIQSAKNLDDRYHLFMQRLQLLSCACVGEGTTSPYITLHHLTSPYITLHHLTLPYITLHHLTLPYITLHHLTSPTLPYNTLHYHTLPTHVYGIVHLTTNRSEHNHYCLRVSSSLVSGGGTYPGRLVVMRWQSSDLVAKSGNLAVTSSSMSETPQSAIFSLISALPTNTAKTQRAERIAVTH